MIDTSKKLKIRAFALNGNKLLLCLHKPLHYYSPNHIRVCYKDLEKDFQIIKEEMKEE